MPVESEEVYLTTPPDDWDSEFEEKICMPELRKDPIISRWVIISTERGKRPHDFVVEPEVTKGGFCPFCPGNEHTTPPEIMAYREGGGAS